MHNRGELPTQHQLPIRTTGAATPIVAAAATGQKAAAAAGRWDARAAANCGGGNRTTQSTFSGKPNAVLYF